MKVLKEPAGVPPAPDPRAKANAKAKTGKQMAVGWKKIKAEPEEDDDAKGEEEEPKEDDAKFKPKNIEYTQHCPF